MKENNLGKYFYIYAYCFITRGRNKFSIYDSLYSKLYSFDNELYEVAALKMRQQPLSILLNEYNDADKQVIINFVDYLEVHRLGRYVSDISRFPLMEVKWDAPYYLKRCIIDIRNRWHNFDDIFRQLSALLCPKIEIRSYKKLSFQKIQNIVSISTKYDFGAIFFVIPFQSSAKGDFMFYSKMIAENSRIYISVYGVPDASLEELQNVVNDDLYLSYHVSLTIKSISGKDNCGVINACDLHTFSIDEVFENQLYNGCLNRLISIDEDGYIRNCPSMPNNYGHIANTSLESVYQNPIFQNYWFINNSTIEGCSECEKRVICRGCRAYIENTSNPYSRPKKCSRLLDTINGQELPTI